MNGVVYPGRGEKVKSVQCFNFCGFFEEMEGRIPCHVQFQMTWTWGSKLKSLAYLSQSLYKTAATSVCLSALELT